MLFRYLLFLRERPIAIKYNQMHCRCIVGGHPESLIEMQSIITDYFEKKHLPRGKYNARNKVRLEFDLSNKKFNDAIKRMQEYGLRIQTCRTHGRLMR